ncbi:hypothetical protein QCD60_27355 [Pokkaliibacter sp. MBI-7]|uniref:hypothetical protein n=1 Tax=Pokkaliibacter sp. MBI-7 TaxID=3040600 RepID=UPI002448600C|nr:hypothetical protein [Pokkaliibacter sp. MBI-7]MDH2436254.1 hypothetical protein [Pokkaliibacter sp. MBI-7]
MKASLLTRSVFLSLILLPLAHADDISSSIEEGLTAYNKHDLKAAKQALDYASQLIAQQSATALSGLMPEPLAEWTAEAASTDGTSAMGLLGGGIQVSRTYTNSAGNTVEMQITADSPLLAQWMPMLANPAMAATMGKVTKIGKTLVLQGNDEQLTMIVANRFMVTVNGSATMDEKMTYAKALDQGKLEAL